MSRATSAAAVVVVLAVVSPTRAEEPLAIAKQGYFFVGGKYSAVGDKQVMNGQIYVEYQIPKKRTQPYPLVIVPGAAQTATNFNGTPDGREGWTQHFLRRGYAVYIVEQPGRGRSSYQPDTDGMQAYPEVLRVQQRFTAPEKYTLWPQAKLHTQWPGTGMAGDPIFDQFYAQQLQAIANFPKQQELNRDAGAALIDRIGPAILLTHSQSGAFGWPIADARPKLVKAIVAVEPSGPPVHDVEFKGAPDWFADNAKPKASGLGEVPLAYEPSGALAFVRQDKPDRPDLVRCWLQQKPARQLVNLKHIPVLIVMSEASYHASYDHCTAQYLAQAGVKNTFVRLADAGIHGNGHMMMLEKNNDAIAGLMADWLAKTMPGKTKTAR